MFDLVMEFGGDADSKIIVGFLVPLGRWFHLPAKILQIVIESLGLDRLSGNSGTTGDREGDPQKGMNREFMLMHNFEVFDKCHGIRTSEDVVSSGR